MQQEIFAIEGWGNSSHARSIIERLGRLIKQSIRHPPLGQNMKKFEHDGL
jgi:hypothetical protein